MRRSVTAKTKTDRVKDMIRRRTSARQSTQLMDHAVPQAVLFSGILPDAPVPHKTPVRVVAEHALSPFIVELKTPEAPEKIIEETEIRLHSANLLDGAPIAPAKKTVAPIRQQKEDLKLATQDIDGQLGEETPVAEPVAPVDVPAPVRTAAPTPQASPARNRTAIAAAPIAAKMNIEELAPPPKPIAPPENVFAHLDLPEEEPEPMESEPVEFEAGKIAIRPVRRHSFRFPALSDFALPLGWQRTIGAFVLLSFAFVLPLHAMQVAQQLREAKISIASTGAAALADLQQGAQSALTHDAQAAANSFGSANSHFSAAQQTVDDLGAATGLLLSSLPMSQREYKTGTSLIEAGNALSLAGNRLADGFLAMQNELEPTPVSRLQIMTEYVASAMPHLEAARASADRANSDDLPADQRADLLDLQAKLPVLTASLQEFLDFSDIGQTVLGAHGKRRYLLVFQNNTELRPTGGFMGSYAEIDVENGSITRMYVPGGGTYDLQGSLTDFVAAPEPLRLLSARWEFQDTNWFADFPSSARQMLEFYGAAGQPSVDGVIAVNATYIADLLALLGPIDLEEYGRTMTSENFVFEAEKIAELEYDKVENQPKAFIGDLAPKMLDRVLDADPNLFLSILQDVSDGLVDRDVQIYFTDEDLQKRILALGWGGDIKATSGDYLMVVHTNLGGGKTDGVISDHIDVHAAIGVDGTITNTVTITRVHDGMAGAMFTGVNNVDYVRVYVPKGSKLLSASGFSIPDSTLFESPDENWQIDTDVYASEQSETIDEASNTKIFEESGKTVFGNWMQTKPGTSSTITFTYELPFHLQSLSKTRESLLTKLKDLVGVPQTEGYSIMIQKQSGVLERETSFSLDVPPELQLLWSSHDISRATFQNSTDAVLSALFERM
jgi:hypothetical protein